MPRPNRKIVRREVQRKLGRISDPLTLLPMPHAGENNKISVAEWEEYCQRKEIYQRAAPDFEKQLGRPSVHASQAVWDLVYPHTQSFREDFDALAMNGRSWLAVEEKEALVQVSKQALLIVLDTLVSAGLARRNVSYNMVFDALCRKYSEHHQRSPAQAVRDMRRDTAWRCRRDLLLNGIDANKFWDLVVGRWSDKDSGSNPLFRIHKPLYDGEGQLIRVLLNDPAVLANFNEIVTSDDSYTRPHFSGIKVLFAYYKIPKWRTQHEMCAEVPYNEVKIGKKSKELLFLQSEACLLLDVTAFKEDYAEAHGKVEALAKRLRDDYIIDAFLSNTRRQVGKNGNKKEIWSLREEYVYYLSIERGLAENCVEPRIDLDVQQELNHNSEKWERHYTSFLRKRRKWSRSKLGNIRRQPYIEELVRAALVTREWRQEARQLLADFDLAQRHIREYARVYEQVKDLSGYRPIRSSFNRVVNRRYQPAHFWPTYVTSKHSSPPEVEAEPHLHSEREFDSYRKKWFKARDPETGKPCSLVGFDVSSSQTQIVATLLGAEELERLTMGSNEKSFKEIMAAWAWNKHQDPKDIFRLNQSSRIVKDYEGPGDPRLQELCKALWMRVSYGGSAQSVVVAQISDQQTYGPGWNTSNANLFLQHLYEKFPEVKAFLAACRRTAQLACQSGPCTGVIFTDPSDAATVRWNPVVRGDVRVGNMGHKLIISLPGKTLKNNEFEEAIPNADGEYPVDSARLRRMVAPCLVHMLDSYYSTLVMEKLARRGITDFVGVHDCWLVPEKVRVGSVIRDGIEVIDEVMKEAAREWYVGLKSVYEDFLKYLASDRDFGDFIRSAQKKWQKRVTEGYRPVFLAKHS